MTALAMSPRGLALQRTFAAALQALEDHAKTAPAEAAEIFGALASHLKSGRPLVLMEAQPMPMFDESAVASISRELADGCRIDLSTEADALVMRMSEPLASMLPIEVFRLRADLAAVASSIKHGGR